MLLRPFALFSGLALAATQVRAQCVIESDKPAQIHGAKIRYDLFASPSAKQTEKPTHFRYLVRLLRLDTERIDNQVARWYLLGKTYSTWVRLDTKETKPLTTREDVGLYENAKGSHDIYAAIDSAFNEVEKLNPACADSTERWRQITSGIAYGAANKAFDAGKYDSAISYGRRALVANPKGAAPWNLISEASRRLGDTAGYKAALRRVSQSTEKDPAMQRVRETALYNLAIMDIDAAQAASGDAQRAAAEKAEASFREYLKAKPGDPSGLAGLSRALRLKGDTAAANAMMNDMMANPAQFSGATLFEAATAMYSAGNFDNSAKLWMLGLAKVPNYRNALFSLTSTLISAKQYDSAVVVARRLLAVDPTSVPNFQQAYSSWRGMLQTTTNEALKAQATDSSVHYGDLRVNAPTSVEGIDMTPGADSVAVRGVIQNRSTAAKSYTIEFEFTNAAGAVVGSASVTVPDVPAKTGKQFALKAAGKGAIAWRYKPVH